jgi:hypothetical protein
MWANRRPERSNARGNRDRCLPCEAHSHSLEPGSAWLASVPRRGRRTSRSRHSERYEVGDAREWMDDAVADETPKAGLGEMLGTKPAFRHQRLVGFLHDRMS